MANNIKKVSNPLFYLSTLALAGSSKTEAGMRPPIVKSTKAGPRECKPRRVLHYRAQMRIIEALLEGNEAPLLQNETSPTVREVLAERETDVNAVGDCENTPLQPGSRDQIQQTIKITTGQSVIRKESQPRKPLEAVNRE